MKHLGIVIGTYAEVEPMVKNAFMGAPNRSDRRRAEIEDVAERFIARGERVFWWGSQLYIVTEDPDLTPQQIGSILIGYLDLEPESRSESTTPLPGGTVD